MSFRKPPGLTFPLATAKDEGEKAVTGLNFTVIQASWFMEVWLSPALGFDYANAAARIYGRRTIEFGGPEAALRAQFEEATDSMQKSFAALMLGYLHGNAIDMARVVDTFGIKLTSIDEYARAVLGKSATA